MTIAPSFPTVVLLKAPEALATWEAVLAGTSADPIADSRAAWLAAGRDRTIVGTALIAASLQTPEAVSWARLRVATGIDSPLPLDVITAPEVASCMDRCGAAINTAMDAFPPGEPNPAEAAVHAAVTLSEAMTFVCWADGRDPLVALDLALEVATSLPRSLMARTVASWALRGITPETLRR